MKRRIAVKRLTRSDLTLFEHHFRTGDAGNQKAINLNADVFVQELYPALPEIGAEQGGKLPIDLFIYGPAAAPEWNLQRKIIKHGTYKNWRLDGEFIREDVGRFACLQPNDIAILEFEGHPVPTTMRLVLIASSESSDGRLHTALASFLGSRSMASIPPETLGDVIGASTPDDHPARVLVLDAAIEDAALGGAIGSRRLRSLRGYRRVTPAEFKRARANAEAVGELGEELVYSFLRNQSDVSEVVWSSQENAISPFDFDIMSRGRQIYVEVKSTTGDHERRLHISASELSVMAQADPPCHLFRVFRLTPDGAQLRIAVETQPVAERILRALEALPEGVTADTVSIDPVLLAFGDAIFLSPIEEE